MHKIFQLSVIYSGYCAQVPHDLTYCNSHILSAVPPPPSALSLPPLLHKKQEVWLCYFCITYKAQLNGHCQEQTTFSSLSLRTANSPHTQHFANSLYNMYIIQSNDFWKNIFTSFLSFLNIEKKSFAPLQQYGNTILAILENSPLTAKDREIQKYMVSSISLQELTKRLK